MHLDLVKGLRGVGYGLALAVALAARPAAAELLVSGTNGVVRYNAATGAYTDVFIGAGAGGLGAPGGVLLGGDGNLYVADRNNGAVLRFNAATGAFVDVFVTNGSGGLTVPLAMQFGPDGNLYVVDLTANAVRRYNGITGAYLDTFVPAGSGGLSRPRDLVFGPDGNLYVTSANTSSVLRYDGTTGAFIDAFVPSGSGGLSVPYGLTFGPDGNLYVTDYTGLSVLRYHGKGGAFIDIFVTSGSGGLDSPAALAFGPDGNLAVACLNSARVLRYNGASGAPLGPLVSSGSGGLVQPASLLFLPPQAPTGLTATPTYQAVTLSWTDNSEDETAFAIWRESGSSDWTRVAAVPPNTTTYTDSGLTPGVVYTYRVRAISYVGASGWTGMASAAPWALLPAPPTGLTATTASDTQIALGWTDSGPNVTGYAIWRKPAGGLWTMVAMAGPKDSAYTDTGLTSDTSYAYRVRAVNDYFASDWSNEADATTAASPPPAPSGLTATVVSHSQINLAWTDNSTNETAFAIWRQTGTGTWVRIGVVPPHSTSYVDSSVSPSTTYTYRVRAVSLYFASAWSNQVTATTGA